LDTGRARGKDGVDFHLNQFGREIGEPLDLPFRGAVLYHKVVVLDVSQLGKCLHQGRLTSSGLARRRTGTQYADPPDLPRLLPLGGERPGEEAARERADERSAVHHSMT